MILVLHVGGTRGGEGRSSLADYVLIALSAVIAVLLVAAVASDSTRLWLGLTSLGEESAYVVLSIAVMTLIDADAGVAALLAVIASGALVIWLKEVFALPRPPRALWREPAEGYGFPSGHTQVSASFWSLLSLRFRRVGLAALSVAVVAAIATSRVGLHVHYVRDVLGGAAFGLIVGACVWALIMGPGRRFLAGPPISRVALALPALSIVVGVLSLWEGFAYGFDTSFKLGGLAFSLLTYPFLAWRIRVLSHAPLPVRVSGFIATTVIALVFTGVSKRLAEAVGAWVYGPAYFFVGLAILVVAAATPSLVLKRLESTRAGSGT